MQQRNAEVGYGSDMDGLIWGYLFEPGRRRFRSIWPRGANLESNAGSFAGCTIHFRTPRPSAACAARCRLPEPFYSSFSEKVGSTRLEQEDDNLIAVIHDVLYSTAFDSASVSTVSLCVTPRLTVSARLRPLRSWTACARPSSPASVSAPRPSCWRTCSRSADVLVGIVRETTARVDAVEDQVLASRALVSRAELGTLRRSLVRLQRLLAPEPAALFRLLSRPPAWIQESDQQDMREAAEELTRAVADSVALNERVKLLQEELAALVNEQTNQTLYILTLVTVLALPINVVAGLMGMNVGGIPLAGHEHGFVAVVSVLLAVTSGLGYLVLRRRRER